MKIIIADKECGLTYQRRVRKENKKTLRRQGFLPEERHINITPEVCEYCLECTTKTGCPGLTIENTLYGPKIATDLTHCVSDGACAKVKACPSFEEVIIHRQKASSASPRSPTFKDIPVPSIVSVDDRWTIFTAGVGGQGAGTISAVLVQAAHLEGFRVLFSDKKGLAIRNGGVYAHVILSRTGGVLSPLVPYGKADLILGIDLLEAARALDPKTNLRVAHAEQTAVVVNTALSPTIRMLLGTDPVDLAACETLLKSATQPDGYWGQDLSSVSEHYFGSKLYANMLLLGVACQLGRLPFSLEKLEKAIALAVSADDREMNLQAFNAGRTLVVYPEAFELPTKIYTYASLLEEKKRYLHDAYGSEIAEAYRHLVQEAVLELHIDDAAHRDLALRAYDLVHYEGLSLAERYVSLVLATASKDRREWNFEATKAVIHNAFKVIAIKDEIYVAHLLTSREKRERDRVRYGVSQDNGDRVEYRHFNRPEFTVLGKNIRWDMNTHDWQLNVMKRLRFLRRLLPAWHRDENEFRDWYLSLAARFDADDEKIYSLWVKILQVPETVRGYREIRKPLMTQVRKTVETLEQDIRTHSKSTHRGRQSDAPTPERLRR